MVEILHLIASTLKQHMNFTHSSYLNCMIHFAAIAFILVMIISYPPNTPTQVIITYNVNQLAHNSLSAPFKPESHAI